MSRVTDRLIAETRTQIEALADRLSLIAGSDKATSILADVLIRSRAKATSGGDNRDWTRRRQTNHHTR
ncbi:MAG: hypothetical protein EBS91_05830 [Betaproteobacteria bacterium]|nr:hypothetical protein [Betaproteobacteria bacterium]